MSEYKLKSFSPECEYEVFVGYYSLTNLLYGDVFDTYDNIIVSENTDNIDVLVQSMKVFADIPENIRQQLINDKNNATFVDINNI